MLFSPSLIFGSLALARTAVAASDPLVLDSYASQLSFTGNSWLTREEEGRFKRISSGQGYHWARGGGTTPVSVSYTFYGTGVEFFGYYGYLGDGGPATENFTASVGLSLRDGPDTRPDIGNTGYLTGTPGVPVSLGVYADLTLGLYTVTLRPLTGIVSFTHLMVNMKFGGTDDQVTMGRANPKVFKPYLVNPSDSSLSLNPSFGQFLGPPDGQMGWSGTQNDGSQRAGTKVLQDRIDVHLGVGNGFVTVNGTLNRNHGAFRVALSPAPPRYPAVVELWGYCPWQVFQSQLYAIGLDPDTEYNLTVTNLHNYGSESLDYQWFDVTAITLWKVPTSAKATADNIIGEERGSEGETKAAKSSPPVGAIVGGVVGGVAAIGLVGVVAWLLWRRNKRAASHAEPSSYLEQSQMYAATPFISEESEGLNPSYPAYPGPPNITVVQQYPYAAAPLSIPTEGRTMSWGESSSGLPMSAYGSPTIGLYPAVMEGHVLPSATVAGSQRPSSAVPPGSPTETLPPDYMEMPAGVDPALPVGGAYGPVPPLTTPIGADTKRA
ncbi:hypothetical protein CC85DRAFT_311430 [Cutaneotrichosporon oleaginosum]|uniref:Mid2 domain-containing protein n=1 Tax=Cutaneotrichosporon oleaginosum TaxID=879819 RepID=A0A0J0XSH9_9TREE|nr:uncharacterized protein CC85DRAFT_311430 [Cutaneotrichosporon oleaginosum]KLT44027.1 hypothetical protein CC85DRAFT_311430 [Cutaneotrichosporon oleaginosum]TXT04027.1 hypothetical protein COLE_07724 [Cutaneotrichosporon oleaginosum]